MIKFTRKYLSSTIGVLLGALAGYAYYYYVGCASGTCAITSSPINSTLYGAVMGALVANIFETENNNKQRNKQQQHN